MLCTRLSLFGLALLLVACTDGPSTTTTATEGDDTTTTDVDDATTDETTSTSDDTSGTESGSDTGTTDPSTTDDTSETTDDSTSETSETTEIGPYCGDGIKDDGEDCDGGDFGDLTACEDLGPQAEGGESLACTADCKLDISACAICMAPAEVAPCDSDLNYNRFHALELGCTEVVGYDESNATTILGTSFQSPDNDAWRVIKQLGTHTVNGEPFWRARKGEKMLMITTGNLPLPDNGVLVLPIGEGQTGITDNDNPDDLYQMPGIMTHEPGGIHPVQPEVLTPFQNCLPNLDCSDTLKYHWELDPGKGNDVIYFEVKMQVPDFTEGLAIDFAFFTTEYPEWIDNPNALPFNDLAVIWIDSESYTGNISFIDDGMGKKLPLVSTHLVNRGMIAFEPDAPELVGTGFDKHGGATDWLTAATHVKPGEIITLAFAVIDRGDHLYNSALLLDNFRWTCDPCEAGNVDIPGSCGVSEIE
ncbi:MAG: choice-of-anchor L domain-containing protein [Nannocystaceae bacterium]